MRRTTPFAAAILLMPTHAAWAQCWEPFDPSISGVVGTGSSGGQVSVSDTWDPDGPAGPRGKQLVVGGAFGSIATARVNTNFAAWDPTTQRWSSPTTNVASFRIVDAFLSRSNGELLTGISRIGSGLSGITRWNGSQFSWGVNGVAEASVTALLELPNGDIIAAGRFGRIVNNGVIVNNIARWDGTAWRPLGQGLSELEEVVTLAQMPNGDIIAGGFSNDFVPSTGLYRWNGTQWSPFPGLANALSGPEVYDLHVFPDGSLIAAGPLRGPSFGSDSVNIARWDGTTWTVLGSVWGPSNVRLPIDVYVFDILPNGDIIAGGFQNSGTSFSRPIYRFNGTSWSPMGQQFQQGANSAGPWVFGLTSLPTGEIFATGVFSRAGSLLVNNIARWNGTEWTRATPGIQGKIRTLINRPDGSLVAVGTLEAMGHIDVAGAARWNGNAWERMGTGRVLAAHQTPTGELYALLLGHVARWNGTDWQILTTNMPINSSPEFDQHDLVVTPAGEIFAASGTRLRRWDGTQWIDIAEGLSTSAFSSARFNDLHVTASGDVLVAGNFQQRTTGTAVVQFNHIARWNGTTLEPFNGGVSAPASAINELPDGDLIFTGSFFSAGSQNISANRIVRWDGSAWSSMGNNPSSSPPVPVVHVSTDGTLYAGGIYANPSDPYTVSRWTGSGWVNVLGGLRGSSTAELLTMRPSGELIMATPILANSSHSTLLRLVNSPACFANCDCSTRDDRPTLSPADFTCYLDKFRRGDPTADCDNSGGLISPADFTCFLAKYRAGCP